MSLTVPPSLRDLTARYLAKQATSPVAADESEVEPYEVLGGFRPTAAQTWADAVAPLAAVGLSVNGLACPPEWAAFAASGGPTAAVPLAAGYFPQRVSDPSALFAGRQTPAAAERVPGFDALRQWVAASVGSGSAARLLLAAGVAATLGDALTANAMLAAAEPLCGVNGRSAWENQQAAVRFVAGQAADWSNVAGPAGDFNAGMVALFAGKPADAVAPLRRAAEALPASSGWSALAGLYATLAAARGCGHGF